MRFAPARFLIFLGLLAAAVPVGILAAGWRHGILAGFDLAALVFLFSLVPLFRDDGADAMRRRARDNDANRPLILALSAIVTTAILVAIAAELADRGTPPAAFIVASLALAWLFSNAVYALHYAHAFYVAGPDGDRGGLDFPGDGDPDYGDFAYFAFTLGMTFQTSDVSVTDRGLRRVVLLHSLAAFVFNIGVLAFTVNVLGGG